MTKPGIEKAKLNGIKFDRKRDSINKKIADKAKKNGAM